MRFFAVFFAFFLVAFFFAMAKRFFSFYGWVADCPNFF